MNAARQGSRCDHHPVSCVLASESGFCDKSSSVQNVMRVLGHVSAPFFRDSLFGQDLYRGERQKPHALTMNNLTTNKMKHHKRPLFHIHAISIFSIWGTWKPMHTQRAYPSLNNRQLSGNTPSSKRQYRLRVTASRASRACTVQPTNSSFNQGCLCAFPFCSQSLQGD